MKMAFSLIALFSVIVIIPVAYAQVASSSNYEPNECRVCVPDWIKNNAGWWAANEITDQDFLSGIYYMIENGIIVIEIPEKGEITKEEQLVLDRNLWEFERYLDRIIKTIENDTRYIAVSYTHLTLPTIYSV